MQRNQIFLLMFGFIVSNLGLVVIYGSVSAKFWTDTAEILRLMIVTGIFGIISIFIFKKIFRYNEILFSKDGLPNINRQLAMLTFLLFTVSFIVNINTLGSEYFDLSMLFTSLISSLIFNTTIFFRSKYNLGF